MFKNGKENDLEAGRARFQKFLTTTEEGKRLASSSERVLDAHDSMNPGVLLVKLRKCEARIEELERLVAALRDELAKHGENSI